MTDREAQPPVRFGVFEVDLPAGQLRRQGYDLKLQDQPFQILTVLLERPGEVVSREELQKKVWPADTFVDFERGLNRAINKLRDALGDDADNPRFIQTVPKRGYRFLAPVEYALPVKVVTAPDLLRTAVPPDRAISGVPPARKWFLSISAGILLIASSWALLWTGHPRGDRPFLQVELDAGSDGFDQPAISADGKRIAFVSGRGLVVRRLDQPKSVRLSGTEGASLPFFSPSGQWLAFFADGKLQKIALDGGEVVSLCAAPEAHGASWGEDDIIVAALRDGLFEVSASGGAPRRLTDSRAGTSGAMLHRWPQLVGNGKAILFAETNGSWQGSLRVLIKGSSRVKTIVENATYGRILADGYLVYLRTGSLFVARFDPAKLELSGPPVPLVQDVFTSGDRADFDVSQNGTLIYRSDQGAANLTVVWVHSSGTIEPAIAKPARYLSPRLSPDGSKLAVAIIAEEKQNLWVYEFAREAWSRVTNGRGPDWLPTWSPDGQYLVFRSGNALAWTRLDGSGKIEELADINRNAGPWSFSKDGKFVALWPLEPGSDLWIARVERAAGQFRLARPEPLLSQPGSQGAPAISPDGRWLAYTSDESGRFEVYVSPFAPGGTARENPKWLVSTGGGWAPLWASGVIFYQGLNGQVSSADYQVRGDVFTPQKPRVWSDVKIGDSGFVNGFDVSRDGKRVLALVSPEDHRTSTLVRVQLNLDADLRQRLTTRQTEESTSAGR